MKNSLPRLATAHAILLTAFCLWGGTSALEAEALPSRASGAVGGAAPQVAAGNQLLLQAAARLERRQSVSARLAHRISLEGSQLSGRGIYLQQGSGEDVRIRLELHVAGQDASLLQVSNSRFVWFDRRLPTGRTVTRIDLRQLRSDPVLSESNVADARPGTASWSGVRPDLVSQFGGLPRLLATLSENFDLLPPQAMRLVSANASPEASVPYFAVVGHWKPEKLALLLGDPAFGDESVNRLDDAAIPSRVPLEALLLFGQSDLFPYRVEYRRPETPLNRNAGTPIPFQLSSNPIVVLEFSNVVFDAPIAASEFDYTPRDVNWVDQTAAVLEKLRRARQANVAMRPGQTPPAVPAR